MSADYTQQACGSLEGIKKETILCLYPRVKAAFGCSDCRLQSTCKAEENTTTKPLEGQKNE